jgi:hypothetical protein
MVPRKPQKNVIDPPGTLFIDQVHGTINENPEPGQEGSAGFSTMHSMKLVGSFIITSIYIQCQEFSKNYGFT